jgi:hypothetical protein
MFASFLITFVCLTSLSCLYLLDFVLEGDRRRSKLIWFFLSHVFCACHDYWYIDCNYDISLSLYDTMDNNYENKLSTLYLVAGGIWLSQLLELTIFSKTRDIDIFTMFSHHILTLLLLLVSFRIEKKAFGVLILFQHDTSDILVSFTKLIAKYRPNSLILKFSYIAMLLIWAYYRLYWFSYVLVVNTLVPKLFEIPMMWKTCVLMLVILAFLHHYWFFLMIKIAFKPDKVKAYESS